jgi:autotransporter-associated beta strand protein
MRFANSPRVFDGSIDVQPGRRGAARWRLVMAAAAGMAGAAANPVGAADNNNVFVYTGSGGTAAAPVSGNFSSGGSFSYSGSLTSVTFGDLNTELQFGGSTTYDASNDTGTFTLNQMQFGGTNPAGITVDGSGNGNIFNFTASNQGSTTLFPQIIQNGPAPVTIAAPLQVFNTSTTTLPLIVSSPGTGPVNLTGGISLGAADEFNISSGTVNISGAGIGTATAALNTGGFYLTGGTINFVGNAGYQNGNTTYSALTLGGTNGSAVATINTTGTLNLTDPDIGGQAFPQLASSVNGAAGALYQSNGTLNFSQGKTTVQYMSIGAANNTSGAYGYYQISGGNLNSQTAAGGTQNGGGIRVGASGCGVFLQTGGTVTLGRYLDIGNQTTAQPTATSDGVATFTGGTCSTPTAAGSNIDVAIGDSGGTGTLNIGTEAGGNSTFTVAGISSATNGLRFDISGGTSQGTLNLNAGTLQLGGTALKSITTTGNRATINFNGGTFQALTSTTLIASSIDQVNLYNGGLTLDTQGYTATIAAGLKTATGSGIYENGGTLSAASFSSVSAVGANTSTGLIGPPIVTVTGGSATATGEATAIATVTNGTISGVTFTSPGQGYQAGDVLTFTFTGGRNRSSGTSGYNTFAATYTLQASDLAANGTGGLTKLGSGTLILSATNTYTGATNISNGTLQPTYEAGLPGYNTAGLITVQSGATLALSVGGTGQFTAADIGSIGTNANFVSGSFLGINTTGAGTSGFVVTGNIAGGEGLNKLGTYALILAGNDTYTGATTVSAGTLQINSSSALAGTTGITVSNGASFVVADNSGHAGLAGGVSGGSPITLNITGTGVGGNGALQGPAAAAGTFAGNVSVSTTGGLNATSIGGGANGTLVIAGTIGGSGNVLFTGNSADTTGSTVILASPADYSGESQIAAGTATTATTTVQLATTNGLGVNGGLRILPTNGGNAVFDLHGFNQTVQYLAGSATFSPTAFAGIANSAVGTTSTLNITGGNGSTYAGPIADHLGPAGGQVAVNLSSGSQTLSGNSNYSGGTCVTGGATLTGASNSAFGTGPVTLAGGELALSSAVATPVVSGFSTFGPGNKSNSSAASTYYPAVTGTGSSTLTVTSGLVQQGTSIFSGLQKISVNTGFVANFTYTPSAGTSQADGIAFVVQNDTRGQAAIGSPGGGLGYGVGAGYNATGVLGSIAPIANSEAAEINLYSTPTVGINFAADGLVSTTFSPVSPVVLTSGDPINVTVGYNASATSVSETLTDSVTGATYGTTVGGVNLAQQLNGSFGYIGFTGGTGNAVATQKVTNFTFSNIGGGSAIPNPIVAAAGTGSTLQATVSSGLTSVGVGPVTVQPGATLTLASSGTLQAPRVVLATPSVTFTSSEGVTPTSGSLDIGVNDLDITGQSLAAVTAEVAAGYNLTGGANWQGPGITSAAAANDSTRLTALGVIQNNQGGTAVYTAVDTFDQATPGVADVLVKYTYFGDANLDGKVDGSDYSLIDNGYANHLTGWFNGDFNYDGVVDGSDYALIDNAFNNQGNPQAASTTALVAAGTAQVAGPAAVPEPASLGLAAVAAVGSFSRRRRTGHRGN